MIPVPQETIKTRMPWTVVEKAAANRAPGYIDRCLELGKFDQRTRFIHFTSQNWLKLRHEYPALETPKKRQSIKLGDAAHAILGPIGRAIKWPCLKGDGTTDLKPGSPCAKARDKLNAI